MVLGCYYAVALQMALAEPKSFLAKASSLAFTLAAEQKGRVVVERIKDGSNAAIGGLQIGDVIRGTTARSKVVLLIPHQQDCDKGGRGSYCWSALEYEHFAPSDTLPAVS